MRKLVISPATINSLDRQHERPYILPDVQVARQFKHHMLMLPGEDLPRWTNSMNEALRVCHELGYDDVSLIVDHRKLTIHQ